MPSSGSSKPPAANGNVFAVEADFHHGAQEIGSVDAVNVSSPGKPVVCYGTIPVVVPNTGWWILMTNAARKRHMAAGLCSECSRPLYTRWHCRLHAARWSVRSAAYHKRTWDRWRSYFWAYHHTRRIRGQCHDCSQRPLRGHVFCWRHLQRHNELSAVRRGYR